MTWILYDENNFTILLVSKEEPTPLDGVLSALVDYEFIEGQPSYFFQYAAPDVIPNTEENISLYLPIDNEEAGSVNLPSAGGGINRVDRLFSSLDQANQAISSNDYIPIPGDSLNCVIISGTTPIIYYWAFDTSEFLPLAGYTV